MASKKNLKKDISFLVDEVLGTCLIRLSVQEQKDQTEIENIIEEMLIFKEEMINKVNNPELAEEHKSLRSYYRALREELINHINKVFEKLNDHKE